MLGNADKTPRSVGTHDGTFHADEVTACALLILFDKIDQDKVTRSRNPERLARCEFICDVGGIYDPARKLFDHHQADYQGPLSSAGMVLKYLKSQGDLKTKEYHFFNHSLIQGIDDHDNGRAVQMPGVCSFSNVISNFAPIANEVSSEEQDAAFKEALKFVLGHLDRLWKRYRYNQECKDLVAASMAESLECLMFERNIPWQDNFFELGGKEHPARFVIMPSGKHWKLRGIPPNEDDRMSVRLPLPEAWAGLIEKDLQVVSGIPGAIFCHKGRFISVWKTKEDAIKALELALKEKK